MSAIGNDTSGFCLDTIVEINTVNTVAVSTFVANYPNCFQVIQKYAKRTAILISNTFL